MFEPLMAARRLPTTRCWRAALGWAMALTGGLGGSSCIAQRGFPCERDAQCVLAQVQGRCEPEQYCSYPDDDCDGGRRFEARAPDGLAGECVGAVGSSGSSDTTGVGESTGPDPLPACDVRPCTTQGLVVGDVHGCVRDGDDRLWCWGGNELGQLGRGVTSPAERCPGPTVELGAITQASASAHMCALDGRARVFCWGNNADDQVDWHAGTPALVRTPVEVLGLDPKPEVLDVGPTLSCVASGTTVTCWGLLEQPSPFAIDAPASVMVLATGAQHACAVVEGGAVTCVGVDGSGQLGDGDPGASGGLDDSLPIASGAALVDAGYFHSCAVVTTGLGPEVQCWGANESGQCGAPVETTIVSTPTKVPNLVPGPYQALALGAAHSCVLAADGRVQCWGDDADGQVGPNAPAGFGAHTVVLEGDQPLVAIEIGAGGSHTCARTAADGVVCWGNNGSLQLGAASSEVTRTHHWLEIGCD